MQHQLISFILPAINLLASPELRERLHLFMIKQIHQGKTDMIAEDSVE